MNLDLVEAMARAMYETRWVGERRVGKLPPPPDFSVTKPMVREQKLLEAKAALRAHELWLAEQGLVVVPREPTDVMLNDAAQACLSHGLGDFLVGSGLHTIAAKLSDKEIKDTWQAMITAAQEERT